MLSTGRGEIEGKTLSLEGCSGVTDVRALGGVHDLNLSECSNITDVSALGGVHDLNLSGCDNITDVSALQDVPLYDGPDRF